MSMMTEKNRTSGGTRADTRSRGLDLTLRKYLPATLLCLLALSFSFSGCISSGKQEVGPTSPTDYYLRITADPDMIPADAQSQSLIIVEVVDDRGDPAVGVSIILTATLGKLEAYEYNSTQGDWTKTASPRTSEQGRVIAYLTSANQVGTAEVKAVIENLTATVLVHFL